MQTKSNKTKVTLSTAGVQENRKLEGKMNFDQSENWGFFSRKRQL